MSFPSDFSNWLRYPARKKREVMRAIRKTLSVPKYYLDFYKSQRCEVDLSGIQTVCLALGPYRNLTTLIAGIVFLHPRCQVLNHAGGRIFPLRQVNFFLNYSQPKFDNFVGYAIYLSQNGRKGSYGGSITFAHAFANHEVMRQTYQNRYGDSLVKKDIRCLFWKESMRVSNFIKRNHIDLGVILAQNDKLRFLMPIRNPLDCAISNYNTGHAKYLRDANKDSLESILDSILAEISWFLDLQDENPERFFCFYEDEFDENVLLNLAKFLRIAPGEHWIRDALRCYQLKKPYDYDGEFIDYYARSLQTYLGKRPNVLEKLSRFSK